MVEVESRDQYKLKETITEKIKEFEDVTTIITCVVADNPHNFKRDP